MGSSLSLPSKEKRRRSNRLSKPPQIQKTDSDCSNQRSAEPTADQALSLPSTPTTWQDPWSGNAVPVSPKEAVSRNPRSQSFSLKPLRRETTSRSDGLRSPIKHRRIHSTTDIWPHSPVSPTFASSRRGSMYGRTSFHPSETATFQPTTLQSNPQSPLIGQPKRSYSVHSSSQRSKSSAQRLSLDRFASLNSHSRVNIYGALPVRRRSLLVRPGVATRKGTKCIPRTLLYEHDHCGADAPGTHNALFGPGSLPYMAQADLDVDDPQPQSLLRPRTPSDFEYTHLGTLKLGTLRVVNGSASPCPSDRTRLDQAGCTASEALPESVSSADLLSTAETECHLPRPKSLDSLEVYTKYYPIFEDSKYPESIVSNVSLEPRLPSHKVPGFQATTRSDVPATTLSIPSDHPPSHDHDFPASPFSFESSPTPLSCHRLGFGDAEDEGLFVQSKERALASCPEKTPTRNLSYSSCASSQRRADSGYSSAASHRNSIDSHGSLRRSPGFRNLTFTGSYRELELCDTNIASGISSQWIIDRHPSSYQNRKLHSHVSARGRPMSMIRGQRERAQIQTNNRPRGSSLPNSGVPNLDHTVPLYCAQLGRTDSATPAQRSSITPYMVASRYGQIDRPLSPSRRLKDTTAHLDTFPASNICDFEADTHGRAGFNQHTAALPASSPDSSQPVATRMYRCHSSGVRSESWLSFLNQDLRYQLLMESLSNELAAEPPRGRTRSRSIGHPHRAATLTEMLA